MWVLLEKYSRIRTVLLGKTKIPGTVHKMFQDFYVYRTSVKDQGEYIIIHIQIIWSFLVGGSYYCCIGIYSSYEFELTCCVPWSADYERLGSSKVIGSAVRAPRGDESVHSPALIYMLSLVLCVPRKTKPANSLWPWCTCITPYLCRCHYFCTQTGTLRHN